MPSLEQVRDFIYSNCVNISETKSGTHFHCRCPLCGDSQKSKSKKRFHLQFDNENSIYWQCWNCGLSGNFYELYSELENVSIKEAFKLFNRYNEKIILNTLKPKPQKINKKSHNFNTFNYILKDCIGINDDVSGYILKKYQNILKEFIQKRCVDIPLYICYQGTYKNRIIIPIWENDDIIYFQGRRIYEGMEPKYLNPSVEKSNILMNKNNFDKDKSIVLNEGIIDADMIGNQGSSFIGKEITQDFIDLVKKYTNKDIIINLDNDKDGMSKLNEYVDIYKSCKFFIMPDKYNTYKDLNDLVVNRCINKTDMYEFVLNNSYIREKTKMMLTWRK